VKLLIYVHIYTKMAGGTGAANRTIKNCVVSVPLHIGLFPVLEELLSTSDAAIVQNLKDTFSEAEKKIPGFTNELLNGVIQKESHNEINFTKSLLRMAGEDSREYRLRYDHEEFRRLSNQAKYLKQILARIPDEMSDRPRFLQTIKDIASAIKDLLTAVNEALKKFNSRENKRALDQQKKEFVRCSKSFSDTLKSYFRDGSEVPVFASANRLIHQTNSILISFNSISPD